MNIFPWVAAALCLLTAACGPVFKSKSRSKPEDSQIEASIRDATLSLSGYHLAPPELSRDVLARKQAKAVQWSKGLRADESADLHREIESREIDSLSLVLRGDQLWLMQNIKQTRFDRASATSRTIWTRDEIQLEVLKIDPRRWVGRERTNRITVTCLGDSAPTCDPTHAAVIEFRDQVAYSNGHPRLVCYYHAATRAHAEVRTQGTHHQDLSTEAELRTVHLLTPGGEKTATVAVRLRLPHSTPTFIGRGEKKHLYLTVDRGHDVSPSTADYGAYILKVSEEQLSISIYSRDRSEGYTVDVNVPRALKAPGA